MVWIFHNESRSRSFPNNNNNNNNNNRKNSHKLKSHQVDRETWHDWLNS